MARAFKLTETMIREARDHLTLRHSIVVVAQLLTDESEGGRVCLADLVVRCHALFPERFGLHGRSDLPCSNRVYSKLAGTDGVCERGKGWIARGDDNHSITVTRSGTAFVRQLFEGTTERATCMPAPAAPRAARKKPSPPAPAPSPRVVVQPLLPREGIARLARETLVNRGASASMTLAVHMDPSVVAKEVHLWTSTGPRAEATDVKGEVLTRVADLLWACEGFGAWPGHLPRSLKPPQKSAHYYAQDRLRTLKSA